MIPDAWILLDAFIDIVQTVVMVWALLTVRSGIKEGMAIMRGAVLDRMHKLEQRVDSLEKE